MKKIDLSAIDNDAFFVKNVVHPFYGQAVLINPKKVKMDWSLSELHFRSIITDVNGNILCSGFPKFFNYTENKEYDKIVLPLIKKGNVFFSEKMDGSLLIRTVINGAVCLRTRGSYSLGEFEQAVMSLINEKYSNIMNPDLYSDVTLLFEYTSPANRIVIKYDDSFLTSIGMIKYDRDYPRFIGTVNIINEISSNLGVKALRFFDFPLDLDSVSETVKDWIGAEGIVAWCYNDNEDFYLTKIKAAEYVRIHSILSHLTESKVGLMCYENGFADFNSLRAHLCSLGLDWENTIIAQEYFDAYIKRKSAAIIECALVLEYLEHNHLYDNKNVKEVVSLLKERFGALFNLAIQLYRKNDIYADDYINASALDVSMTNFRASIKAKDGLKK